MLFIFFFIPVVNTMRYRENTYCSPAKRSTLQMRRRESAKGGAGGGLHIWVTHYYRIAADYCLFTVNAYSPDWSCVAMFQP